MSSKVVRDSVTQFLRDNIQETVIDITGQYDDVRELLQRHNVPVDAPWLALEFAAGFEEPRSLTATNDQGLYREFGQIFLHVCEAARIGVGASLVNRGEALCNLFRGVRIGDVVVQDLTPLNTGPGSTLEFEAGYVAGTVGVGYYCDKKPSGE